MPLLFLRIKHEFSIGKKIHVTYLNFTGASNSELHCIPN